MRSWAFLLLVLLCCANSHAHRMQATRIGIYLAMSMLEIAALVTSGMNAASVQRVVTSAEHKPETYSTEQNRIQYSLIKQARDTLIAVMVLGTFGTVTDLYLTFPFQEILSLSELTSASILREHSLGVATCTLNLILTTASISYPISQLANPSEFLAPILYLSYASTALFAVPVFAALTISLAYIANIWMNPSIVMGIVMSDRRQAWSEPV